MVTVGFVTVTAFIHTFEATLYDLSWSAWRDTSGVDLLRFDELATRARQACDDTEALTLFAAALACWRGSVLADLPERLRQHPAAIAVSDRRLSATLAYADLALAEGSHEQAATHLRALVSDEPLHEGLQAKLMLVLASMGRQAAALTLFTDIRRGLRDELGVEPGAELRAAHLSVLRGQVPAKTSSGNCLPRDVPDFTGRHHECRALLGEDDTSAVTVIDGMAGVGKTALAVHLAHALASRYPDGGLFFDLHAHTTDRQPLAARDALESLLRQLGVEGERIPKGVDDCATLWRALAGSRRLLVVLDNVADAGQVRQLLPNGRHNRTLVTSRCRLPSVEGAGHLSLDVLPESDAAALFARAHGKPLGEETGSTAEVLRLCGFLPLAVRIAAAKARAPVVDRGASGRSVA
ncbi:NB-ARC domain-containing protein [Amycolatopsis xylanica]|uniref:NB-ARC domain-containing protein n=1 Tax=Amycolatopsis xylanica TaxID=589385 RepID=A0A1H3RDP4_9PSEU|nr:BTAD domain-containing putative transcriptional regulator [Amycolatopsis xylanica]SDZ23673.1 NB-ARC domain-containing protein [Amycolatopsis xylanica]